MKIGIFTKFDMLNGGGGGVVWVKVYVVEVKVEVGWMDDVSAKNPVLLVGPHSVMRLMPFPRRHSRDVQSMGYIQGFLSLDF